MKEKGAASVPVGTPASGQTPASSVLVDALVRIAAQQPKTLGWIRRHGIVFDGTLGTEPDNWEHVAFSIYTDLCEVDAIARNALAETCEHAWVDMRNEAILSGEWCPKCGAIQATSSTPPEPVRVEATEDG